MKLVIGGSTGFVGTELVRQALSHPAITTIVGFSRRRTDIPPGSVDNAGKLKSVVCENFESYSDNVKEELKDADACICRTIAVTPLNFKSLPWEETVKICRDYALTAIETLAEFPRREDEPLRFVYISGHFAPRSRADIVKPLVDYGLHELALLRGDIESRIVAYAEQSNGAVVSCIAKPGMIAAPGRDLPDIPGVPKIELRNIAAALLEQAVGGFEKDILSNDDMTRIGQKALAEQQVA
ncbi:hypothetical protein SLS62_005053 [Diatrype stigma]|uniref:NAD(P)-binding domain-containing protein n=1 Tax=Diatrype stigma TaxID=117547 RepID=A0AAN9V1Q3_9PEZI